ncbi:hypothetical protein Tco_0060637 [Tanacetum coccineum]
MAGGGGVEVGGGGIRNVEGIVDINELFRKLKFVCHWVDSFKNLKWSNVPGIKLSLFSKSDDSFTSLQALLNLHYFLSGFMDYFWSCKLNISNFSPANRRILPMGASCTQRKVSLVPFVFSIPFVLSWGGSISSDSFLPSILLLVVIIITVVIVVVILIVVIVVVVGVVIVVAIIGVVVVGGVSFILKLSFVIT